MRHVHLFRTLLLVSLPCMALVTPASANSVTVPASQVARTAESLIASARNGTAIDVEMYEFTNPKLAQALIAAKRKGANVRVIMDASYTGDNATASMLTNAGIPVRRMHVGSDGYTDIDHVKFLLVGHSIALGGVNWGTGSGYTTDEDLEITNAKLAKEGEQFFSYDWRQAQTAHYVRDSRFFPPIDGIQLLTDNRIEPALLAALQSAQSSIEVSMFAMDRSTLRSALIAAQQRGVTVTAKLDGHYEKYLNQAAYNKLKAAGIHVQFAPYSEVLHAKMVNIDNGRILIVGSANWTNSGMLYNHELDVKISD